MATQKNRAAQYVKNVKSGDTGFYLPDTYNGDPGFSVQNNYNGDPSFDISNKLSPLYNNDQAERAAQFVKSTSSGGAWAPTNADKLAPAGSYTVSTFRSAIPGASVPFDYSRKTAYQRALDDVLNPKPYSYDLYADPL